MKFHLNGRLLCRNQLLRPANKDFDQNRPKNYFFRPNPVGVLDTRGGHLIYILFVAQDISDAPKDNQIWISGDIDCKEANFLRWYSVVVFKCARGHI